MGNGHLLSLPKVTIRDVIFVSDKLSVALLHCKLSALCVPWCKKALYKYSSFPFPFLLNYSQTLVLQMIYFYAE